MLLFFCFQFDEKFIQSPEDLEKLKKGNTKCLYVLSEVPQGSPSEGDVGGRWVGIVRMAERYNVGGRAP